MGHPSESEFAWLMLTGILIMFLLALSVVLFFVFYQRRLFAQQTDMERLKLEEQKKRLESEINIQEKERERIARDLHDEVGAILSTIKLYLTFDGEHVDKVPVKEKSTVLIDEAISKLRAISKNLMPENLRLFGLVKTIARHCQQIDESGAIRVHFEHQLDCQLNAETEKHLFRIVQELLNNAIKHAPGSKVLLSLREHAGVIRMHYADDGPGIPEAQEHPDSGLGLISMYNRAQILQGEMILKNSGNTGTEISFSFPVLTNFRNS